MDHLLGGAKAIGTTGCWRVLIWIRPGRCSGAPGETVLKRLLLSVLLLSIFHGKHTPPDKKFTGKVGASRVPSVERPV